MKTADLIRKSSVLAVFAVLMLAACREQFESHYVSSAAAAKDRALERGWLPSLLRTDATEIREWHDIDTNEVRGTFSLSEKIKGRLGSECTPSEGAARAIGSTPAWWPDYLVEGRTPPESTHIYRCGNFFVAIDATASKGYFWTD